MGACLCSRPHSIDFLPGALPPPLAAAGGLLAEERFGVLDGGALLPLLGGGAPRPAAGPLVPLGALAADLGTIALVCGVSIGAARAAILCAASMAA